MKGRFITFEGPEGSGKSTQAMLLLQKLLSRGIRAMYTREPGGTALGEELRRVLQHNRSGEAPCDRAELLLFEASRSHLVEKVIRPALAEGTWVICDRFIDSTTAYQGCGRGLPVDDIRFIHRFTVNGVMPDLTLLLDIPIATGFERITQRYLALGESADRFESEEREFHERVRNGYLALAAAEPDRFRIINAERDRDAVAADVWKVVANELVDGLAG